MGPPLWSLALTTLLSRLCMASSPVIVTPQWLHSNLNAVRVLHVGWGNTSADYDMGHVPTAVHFNTDTVPRRNTHIQTDDQALSNKQVEDGYPRWFMLPLPEVWLAAGAAGLTASDTVVVYSNWTIAAAVIWFTLHYAGAHDVRYLDGGITAWRRAGFVRPRGKKKKKKEGGDREG